MGSTADNDQLPQLRELLTDQIRDHIIRGQCSSLIGVAESDEFDCKGSPYQIAKDSARLELAKDVAAFANARGGLVVIGLATTKHSTHRRDLVAEVRAFARDLVDTERYAAILRSWIYPPLVDVSITWHATVDDDSIGIIIIRVPDQGRANWPFLVMRHIEHTERRSEIIFGYFERKQSMVDHASVHQLHALLRDGDRYSSLLEEQFDRIEQKLSLIHSFRLQEREVERSVEWGRVVTERVAELRESSELKEGPAYSLIAYPSWESTPPGLFERRRTDIVSLLKAPPTIRNSGFDLNTYREVRRTSYGGWRSVLAGVRALEFSEDGCLIFLANGDDYLCWGRNSTRSRYPLLINQLVLIDSTYLFVLLTKQLLALSSGTLSGLNYRLQLSDMRLAGEHAKLQSGALDSYRDHSMIRLEKESLEVAIVAQKDEHHGRTAFRLVAELYDEFGFKEDRVPYVETYEGNLIVSEKDIAAIG